MINQVQNEASIISQNDFLLIDTLQDEYDGQNGTPYKTQKVSINTLKSNLLDDLYMKFRGLTSTIEDLRRQIEGLKISDPSATQTQNDYCILNGFNGILGSDITNYNDITRWEIKFQEKFLSESERRYINNSFQYDTSFLYENCIEGNSNVSQFYNYGQSFRPSEAVAIHNLYEISHGKNIIHTVVPQKVGYLSAQIVIAGKILVNNDVDAFSQQFETSHTISINKNTGRILYDGKSYESTVVSGTTEKLQVLDTTNLNQPGRVDHLLSSAYWQDGLIGKLFYIKGFDSYDDIKANLTPVSIEGVCYLHDSIGNNNVQFRGTGTVKPSTTNS